MMYSKNTDLEVGIQDGFLFQSYPRFLNALVKGIKCSFCQTKLSEKNIGKKVSNEGKGIRIDKYNPNTYWVWVECSKCQEQHSYLSILRRYYKK